MKKVSEFIKYLKDGIGGFYVWGGQGESIYSVIREYLMKKETTEGNVDRIMKLFEKKKVPDLKFYDCSGLFVHFAFENNITTVDMTASTIYKHCDIIKKSDLRLGDMVFKSTNGLIGHIGYVSDIKDGVIMITHAKGRDYGVVEEPITSHVWTDYGRPSKWLYYDLEQTTISRMLKVTSPYMRGEDVRAIQVRLSELGYACEADGIYGKDTEKAVKEFQTKKKLTADGIVGKKTVAALGLEWEN